MHGKLPPALDPEPTSEPTNGFQGVALKTRLRMLRLGT